MDLAVYLLLYLWPLILAFVLGSFALWSATRQPRRPGLVAALTIATVIAFMGWGFWALG